MAPTVSADPLIPNLDNTGYKQPTNPYNYPNQCTFFAWGRAYELMRHKN